MVVITVMLLVLAAVNALLITWATVLDGRHASRAGPEPSGRPPSKSAPDSPPPNSSPSYRA